MWPFLFFISVSSESGGHVYLTRESNTPPRAVVREFMKHFNSIKKNRDFQEVYQTGKSYANKLLVMYVKKTDRPETRIGISVSKKVGNSVVRHHITRLLRESFRLHEDMTETGLDIVVVARAAAKEESYKTIESAYLHLCGLHNILKKESK